MSDPQLEALAMLKVRRCYTQRTTYGDCCISGVVAKALVKHGLAKYVSGYQVGIEGSTVVEITEAGVAAYDAAMALEVRP